MSEVKATDFLIIGAGVIGLSIAREIQKEYSDSKVMVIDKENEIAQHASGRNSGVLHSGIYYTEDSLKARFTRDGNLSWKSYCLERGLQVDRCGKLIVANNAEDLSGIEVLKQRGKINDVEIHELDVKQAREIEPKIASHYPALFVPSTATVNPIQLVESLKQDFIEARGVFFSQCEYLASKNNLVIGNKIKIQAGFIINCAGLYADHIAHDFGFGLEYKIIPFKGLYLYSKSKAVTINSHVYPVPDLSNPFLGVHFTRTMDGRVKIGPTAVPALWRENYVGFDNFNLKELLQVFTSEVKMFLKNNNFRKLARSELSKQTQRGMINRAKNMMSSIDQFEFSSWGRPGIRAQLVHTKNMKLELDFVVQGDDKSLHVLNAVSPAFTCAFPFAKFVVERVSKSIN